MGHSSVDLAGISLSAFYTNIFYGAKRSAISAGHWNRARDVADTRRDSIGSRVLVLGG
jgi:hypothetical protein